MYPGQPTYPGQAQQTPFGRSTGFNPTIPAPGAPSSSQTGGAVPSPYSTSGIPGQQGGNNQVTQMIMNQLTQPRAGGMGAVGGAATGQGGIAGVASKVDGEGIKVYNERTKYKEWEFLYDPQKDKSAQMAAGGQNSGGLGGNQPGNQNPLGQGPGSRGGSFGQQPSLFGQPGQPVGPSPFGQPGR